MNRPLEYADHWPTFRRSIVRWSLAALSALGAAAMTPSVAAQQASSAGAAMVKEGLEDGRVRLVTGRAAVVNTVRPYKRMSVADPEIVAATPLSPTSILLTPKKAGVTQLIVWDDNEKSQMIELAVQADVQVLAGQLKMLFPAASIEPVSANGSIILRGRVPSAIIAEQAVQVAAPYTTKVVNLLEVSGGQQVMLQVKFAEVSRSATNALGVNFGFSDGTSFMGSNIGQVSPLTIAGRDKINPFLALTDPTPAVSIFGKGAVGDTAFAYFVEALRQNNLLRVLAEPNLLAMSGQEASFLAGGEFPVPVPQNSSGGASATITVEFREFGVKLNFVPVVLGNGRVRLKVAPEVSDLDFSTSVKFGGFVVPGLTQRKVSTTVELADGQTFAIAGLLNNSATASREVTPLLGDIPVLGALFRSVRYQRKETELVVLVTPRLAEPMTLNTLPPVPGESWRHPTEADLFLKGDMGGPQRRPAAPTTAPSTGAAPPRFYGQYGFVPATQPSR